MHHHYHVIASFFKTNDKNKEKVVPPQTRFPQTRFDVQVKEFVLVVQTASSFNLGGGFPNSMYFGDFLYYIYFFLNFVFHYLKTHNNLFFDGSNDELTFLSTSSFSLFCLSLSSLCFCKISRIRWRELEDVESGVIETELAPLVPP